MTNHKTEADKFLHSTQTTYWQEGNWQDLDAYHASAQVHATLYLAEQQRIANLIAYVALIDNEFIAAEKNPEPWDFDSYDASNKRREAAQAQVREALGFK